MVISFIIATYKNQHSLEKCIDCIINSAEPTGKQFKIVVINNYHTREYIDPIRHMQHPSVVLLHNQKKGAHASRRMGVYHFSADLYFFIDDDNYIRSDYLNWVLDLTIQHHEPSVYGCANVTYDVIDWEALNLPSTSYACGSLAGTKFKDDIPVFWGAGLAMTGDLARSIYDLPLLVEGRVEKKNYIMSGEDHELALRCSLFGAKYHYYDKIGLEHHINPERLTRENHDKLMTGFQLSGWILRWYYWKAARKFWFSNFVSCYMVSVLMAIANYLLHPRKLYSKLVLQDLTDYKKKETQYRILQSLPA